MAAADRRDDTTGVHVELPTHAEYRRLVRLALAELGGRATRHAITARALALGDFSPRQLSVPPPATHRRYASKIEYRLAWAMTHLKRDGVIENPEPGVWRLPSASPERAAADSRPA